MFLGAALIAEVLAWASSYASCAREPGLLHPQLVPDLVLALGFYLAPALTWAFALSRFRFTAAQVVLTQGAMGLLGEGQGSVFFAGLAALPAGLYIWLVVALVYGSIAGIAFVTVRHRLPTEGRGAGWAKYAVVWLGTIALLVLTSGAWSGAAEAVGLLPERGPICERPFF